MDEELRVEAVRVEAHHDGGVQRSEQVAGHVELEDCLARYGMACKPYARHCERVVEALNFQHAKTLVPPAVRESENVECESILECSCELLRALESQGERASMRDELDADKTSLCRAQWQG